MPDPTEMQSSDQLDPTRAPPEGTLVPPGDRTRPGSEPNFAPPEKPGEVGKLGRYRVLKRVGRGGMGAVYLAFDTVLSRRIALKVMLPQHAADTESRERFLREARAAAMVKSEHVVTLFDVDEERGVPFIAMEYLLGYPLDQYLRESGELPLSQVFRIGRETALGLVAAHELSLVHRDIKPGNIWLEAPHGRVKILDFGLARAQHDETHLTTTGLVVGTPAYMSPEQARGLPLDGRSDLFSLGVVLYRLATGKMPFDGPTTMAVLTSLAVDAPPAVRALNADVPEALEAIITKLLAKAPADRYQTVWEVVEALRAAEALRPITGARPVVVQPVPMAIEAQSENVWEGIEASGSNPQVLDETDEVPSESVAVASPRRKKVARKPSVAPAILAGVALLAAVVLAVLAVVFLRPKNEKEKEPVVQNNPANEKRPPSKTPAPKPAPASDPDRTAAEYVLSLGGMIRVNGQDRDIKAAADLPYEPFRLTVFDLHHNTKVTDDGFAVFKDCKNVTILSLYWAQPITDAGLAHFAGCKGITQFHLQGATITDAGLAHFKGTTAVTDLYLTSPDVTDAGLASFKDSKDLRILSLAGTRVTDAGLAYFKGCAGLTILILSGTPITDAGLVNFKDCKNLTAIDLGSTAVTDTGLACLAGLDNLTELRLGKTKVTKAGVEKFAQALPNCRIQWDGVIDPKK